MLKPIKCEVRANHMKGEVQISIGSIVYRRRKAQCSDPR